MEEYTQITIDMWMQWKEDIRRKLAETAGNFVYIGYRLRQIQNSGMFDGAADIFEFAQKEYGLGKSTVSRFIAINEKYSEGGYSLELKEEYKGFSSSKLSEMLTLPDSEVELITEQTTIREIRELKKFDAQDPSEAQAEESAAPGSSRKEVSYTPLDKCIIDFFRGEREALNGAMELLMTATESDDPDAVTKKCVELIVPSGQASHKKGIVFLFMYDLDKGVKYKLMTEPEPRSMTWDKFLSCVIDIYMDAYGADTWKEFYQAEDDAAQTQQETENAAEPAADEAEAVATSQQEDEDEPEEDGADETEDEAAGEPGEDEERGPAAGDREEAADAAQMQQEEPTGQQPTQEEAAGQQSVKSDTPISLGWADDNPISDELYTAWREVRAAVTRLDEEMRSVSAECAHIAHDEAIGIAAQLERMLNGEYGELPG